jgi:hypothetical protein
MSYVDHTRTEAQNRTRYAEDLGGLYARALSVRTSGRDWMQPRELLELDVMLEQDAARASRAFLEASKAAQAIGQPLEAKRLAEEYARLERAQAMHGRVIESAERRGLVRES